VKGNTKAVFAQHPSTQPKLYNLLRKKVQFLQGGEFNIFPLKSVLRVFEGIPALMRRHSWSERLPLL
jgi:hypothetical protein